MRLRLRPPQMKIPSKKVIDGDFHDKISCIF